MPQVSVFLDSNILIYRRDPRDAAKQKTAFDWIAALARQREGRLSWQVLQEFYVNAVRKLTQFGLSTDMARTDVRLLANWSPLPPDAALFESAFRLQDHYRFAWWDALIVAAALRQDCATLLSEDLQNGLVIDGTLTIVDPFAPDAPPPPAR